MAEKEAGLAAGCTFTKLPSKLPSKFRGATIKKELVANAIGYENLRKPEISDEIQEGKTTCENLCFQTKFKKQNIVKS